ncbi:MAG: rod shape-determining protein [Proteobacteria bacterium]|nr:rod shape-determining protein [Luminiphilus sp.]MBL6820851.1 rod shape-determining protein [Luminiphilus sp.]MDA0651126.1 rod shape-determining protein [Pseudomonadota bacterium]
MLKRLRGMFSTDLSIDLGTANTLIYVKDRGIILDEPSVVAIRMHNGQKSIEAVGKEAKRMLGRTPGNIQAIRPLKDGVIADFQVTEKMLQHFIAKVHESKFIRPSPRVLICVPCTSTQVERRAIRESALSAGAREVKLIEEPMAAAIGAGLQVEEASGCMVVDIGGGTTEIAIISLNGVVYRDSIRIGGDRFDESIVSYVRRKYGSLIGDSTAERIKQEVGCGYKSDELKEIDVRGRHLAEGVPRSFTLTNDEILTALEEPLDAMMRSIKLALEQSPPELAADIAESGIVLTGGGALLTDLDKRISNETGLPVYIAEDPLTCVARGGGKALELMDRHVLDLLSTE